MEILDKKIKEFLKVYNGSGDGYGYGSGSGYIYGSGDGDGFGDGSGDGYGYGYGSGYGSGDGSGSGYGSGDGYGYGDGIKMLNNKNVYLIDNVQTIVLAIHNNIARGLIVNTDLTTEKCYVAKGQNKFAHRQNSKRSSSSITREDI